jgi:hypothetical protein
MRANRILIIVMLLVVSILTQSHAGGTKFGLGLQGGLNFSKLNANGWVSNYTTNPQGGLFVYFNGKKFGLQIEALYGNNNLVTDTSFRGLYNQYLNNSIATIKKGTFTVTQIQVPVLINYKFNSRFWLQGGVMYSANSNVVDKSNLLGSSMQILKTGAVSALGGVWLRLPGRLTLHGRYTLGMSDISNLPSSPAQWYNNSIQVGLGFRFL